MYYLKPKKINITVGNNYVVLLNAKTTLSLDMHPSDRIYIRNGSKEVVAIVDISPLIRPAEIGLYNETWNKLKVKKGDRRVSVIMARKPRSLTYIKEKLDGQNLDQKKFNAIIKDITNEKTLSDVEMTYFVAASYINGLKDTETAALAKAIVNNGYILRLKNKKIIFDKHCIGGVPGNRTTLILVPICAVAGLIFPKTSSRAITSTAGTVDTMEVLANVTHDLKNLKKIIHKTGAFISWGGKINMASADDHLIRVRIPMSLDPQSLMLASILAKKKAVCASHVLIDIPCGPDVKVKNLKEADQLKKRFLKIGGLLGMKMEVIITDGKQPIGYGIGPVLECIDVIKVLKNDPAAPPDLKEKSLKMAGLALELCGKCGRGLGLQKAKSILESLRAWKKFQEIIKAQGPTATPLLPAKFSHQVKTAVSGIVNKINNRLISKHARLAGAPEDKAAGILLHKKIGDKVKKGDPLFTVYAENETRLKSVIAAIRTEKSYKIKT